MSRIYKSESVIVNDDAGVKINVADSSLFKLAPKKVDPLLIDGEEILSDTQKDIAKSVDILSEARREADAIIKKARKDSEHILEVINEEAYQIGLEKGMEQGIKDGYDKGYQEANSIIKEAEEIKSNAVKEKEELLESVESEVVDIMSEIISNVLDNAFTVDKGLLHILVKRGLSHSTIVDSVVVRVSNENFEEVQKYMPEIKKSVDSKKDIQLVEDFNLSENECIIETEYGNIDCGLEQIKSSLTFNLLSILNG